MKVNENKLPPCEVCNFTSWHIYASSDISVTTSGKIVNEPLGKAQCVNCGFLQRVLKKYLGLSGFYEKDYGTYFERLGAENFDNPRYVLMAEWIYDSIKPCTPQTILDVGCGRGWGMIEIKKQFLNSEVLGLEPSIDNSEIARNNGLSVITATLAQAKGTLDKKDLIYANNVIQHAISPEETLSDLKSLINENGLIVIICPDATRPSNEMMWSDQNFSFTPAHLFRLSDKVGLKVQAWRKAPEAQCLLDKQLIVLSRSKKNNYGLSSDEPALFDIKKNIDDRDKYVELWLALDKRLNERIGKTGKVYNFGASMWSYLLRAYCPQYWSAVDACLVDNLKGRFMDKKVLPCDRSLFEPHDTIVLGTNPASHPMLKKRLCENGLNVVVWDDIITR